MSYKIILDNNGTIEDKSVNLGIYKTGTEIIDYTLTQDTIYIGSRFPFNSLYLKQSIANAVTATISIDTWSNSAWKPVVETIDETSVSGAALARDGFITFVPDKLWSWSLDDTISSPGNERILGLGNVTVYDRYWTRINFSATLTATTALQWVGHLFCSEDDLFGEYPIFNDSTILADVETGKINWEEQRVIASEQVINALIRKGTILSGDQLLDVNKLRSATVAKTAEICFRMLGNNFKDELQEAKNEFSKRLKGNIFNVDKDGDAILDVLETRMRPGKLFR